MATYSETAETLVGEAARLAARCEDIACDTEKTTYDRLVIMAFELAAVRSLLTRATDKMRARS